MCMIIIASILYPAVACCPRPHPPCCRRPRPPQSWRKSQEAQTRGTQAQGTQTQGTQGEEQGQVEERQGKCLQEQTTLSVYSVA